jgi:hypothetical protein
MWGFFADGSRQFLTGKSDWAEAAREAEGCNVFRADVEEELVADQLRSCYNCRYRRWTAQSFVCIHPSGGQGG